LAHTRIVLVNMPRMLREIIRSTLASDPACDIVGEYDEHVALEVALDRSRADVVIVSTQVFGPREIHARLLAEASPLKVLAVRPDASQAFLHELHPREGALGELSPERLTAAVRRTGADGRS
jgi:DNA-binding NarL/FixJ family response regulator